MSTTHRHKVYGDVRVTSMYADFWMAVVVSTGEAKSVQPADCVPVEVAEVVPFTPPITPSKEEVPVAAEAPVIDRPLALVNVNTTSSTQLASAFSLLSKTVWRRVKDQQSRQPGGVFADFTAFSEAVLLSTENESDALDIQDRLTFE